MRAPSPNIRATQVELVDGLKAASQNCWPSVEYDVGALNSLVSPLFPAGFYYKTFMWPPAFWNSVYERVIRRAAGLGKAPTEPDPDRYEHRHAHCDVLVVGAGPAGLAAALAAGRSGARVILADQQPEFGGCLLDETDDHPLADWRSSDALGELVGCGRRDAVVRAPPRSPTTTTTISPCWSGSPTTVRRCGPHHVRQRVWKVRAKQVVLATGAIERPLTFAGNDRPGVMLASAVRSYLNRFGVRPGSKAVVFTTNDSAYATALDLNAAGAEVVVVDARDGPGGDLALRAATAGIRRIEGSAVIDTKGGKRVQAVEIGRLNAAGDRTESGFEWIDCDLIAMSGGWNPTIHLHSQSRGRPLYDAERAIFLPGASGAGRTFRRRLRRRFPAGGRPALRCRSRSGRGHRRRFQGKGALGSQRCLDRDSEAPPRILWQVPASSSKKTAKAFVDFQNDVTSADIKLALREGYSSIEHVKRYTTTGMGTDQGKTSNVIALGIVSETTGQPIAELGVTTFRPRLHARDLRRPRRCQTRGSCSTRSEKPRCIPGTRPTAPCSRMSASGSAPGTSRNPART